MFPARQKLDYIHYKYKIQCNVIYIYIYIKHVYLLLEMINFCMSKEKMKILNSNKETTHNVHSI